MSEPLVVALVGAGGWGKNLLRNFATIPEVQLKWVCDLAERARAAAYVAFPRVRCVGSIDDVLTDQSVRAVVIATDPASHHGIARAALLAGKDVFVEKPLALSARHAAELCAIADDGGRVLMVGHVLLYHPAIERLRALIDEGELGDILYLHAQRLNLSVGRRDENAWWCLAPHDIALANYFLGEEPERVSATGGVFLKDRAHAHEVVFATLQYPSGKLAHVHVSRLDPDKTRRMTVVGSNRMAVFDDGSADQKLVLFDKGIAPPASLSYADGLRVRTGDIRIPALRMQEPLRRECEAFVRAVRTREAPLADGRSALAVVRALEAGSHSLVWGGHPAALPGGIH